MLSHGIMQSLDLPNSPKKRGLPYTITATILELCVSTSKSSTKPRREPSQEFITSLNSNQLPSNIRVVDGKYEIDIANSTYNQLSPDWQYENKEAGKVASELVIRGQRQYVSIHNQVCWNSSYGEYLDREQVGNKIHNEWLKRNTWAKGGELDVPFKDLPPHEQAKDIDQYKIAYAIFEKMQQKEQAMQNDMGMER